MGYSQYIPKFHCDPAATVFAKNLVKACELLCALMEEFENFKRSKKIKELIIELNDVEEECDKLYLSLCAPSPKTPPTYC